MIIALSLRVSDETPIADYSLATLPRMLTWHGYQTIAVGKMHFAPEREHHGFNHMYLMEEIPTSRENDAYLQFLEANGYGDVRCQHGVRPILYPTPQVSRVPEEFHGSAWVAHKTNELLRMERDQPFFIWSSWVGPHPPFYVPQKYLELYKDRDFPPSYLTPAQQEETDVPPDKDVNHPWVQRFKEGYFARITLIDAWLGTILDTLEETGQADNTLIIFTSDHGEMLGDRRWFSKTLPYDGSARIPLILSGPGIAAGTQAEVSVEHLGYRRHHFGCRRHYAAGRSSADWRQFIETGPLRHGTGDDFPSCSKGIAAGFLQFVNKWKFIHYYDGRGDELYDVDADPGEQHNLIDSTDHRDIQAKLRQACMAFEQEHGPDGVVSDGDFVLFPAPTPEYRWWPFNWFQFPRWMYGYSEADYAAILQEIRDVLATNENVYVPTSPDWRQGVMETWQDIGGAPEALLTVFEEIDAKMKQQ